MQENYFVWSSAQPSEHVLAILKEKDLYVQQYHWKDIKDPIEQCLMKWGVELLKLPSLKEPFILTKLLTIDFFALKQLYIQLNEVTSIEPISRLIAPLLQSLTLLDNKITKISPLRKANWPNFHNIYLQNNRFVDGEKLTEMNSPKLWDIAISYFETDFDQFPNKNFLLKLQTASVKQLEINSKSSIARSILQRQLKRKYTNLAINTSNLGDDE